MADYSPTIIAASLNDKELQESINKLVTHVEEGTKKMSTAMTNAVEEMKKQLQSLGNINVNTSSASDGGSSRRKKKQEEETQAVKETTISYQNLEAAKQKAIGSSPAQDSYQEFVKNMRQNVALLAMEIKDMPNWSLDRQFGNYMQYERQIEQVRQRIQELKQELQNVASDPNGSRLVIKQITEQIAQEQQRLVQLQKEQITTSKQIELSDKQALAQKQAQYETEKKALVDMSVGKREIVTFGEKQVSQEAKITDEIRKQIEAISNRKDATKAFEQISLMPQGSMEEISAKGKMLQQLLEKVRDTPFMSQTNIKLAERQLNSLGARFRELKQEKERVAETQTTKTNEEQKTEQALERERQALEQVRQAQEARKQAIIDTGVAASQQTERMLASIAEQQKSLDYTKQIEGVKELQVALRQMQNAYNTMDASDPMRDMLRQRIETTKEAISVAQRYNMVVAGIGGFGGSAPKDTIAAYSLEIQRLANIYKTLSVEERNAAAGKGLVNKYQELTKTVSDWQKQLTRPTSLSEAMKGDEKTIDDLTYKIQRLQQYKRGLDFTDKNQASEITQVDNKIKELEKDLQKYMGTTRQAQNANNALTRSWNYMKNRLAFYFTVGASTAFVKNLIEVRSQYEMNERALGILVDSAARGTRIFNELSQMSLVSPYTLIELSTAAKQLTAYDIAAKDVVDTTRRLADMAAAVGAPVERLTYALGQIKAYGYLNSRDARMFANAGIPLVKQLAEYYSELEGKLVSTADVYDRMKNKAIDFNAVMAVVNKMTDEGGKFFDFQAKMADTLKVRLANLTLAWNNMLNAIGKDANGILTTSIKGLAVLFKHWRSVSRILGTVVTALGAYKAATWLAGLTTKGSIGRNAVASWLLLKRNIDAATGSAAKFGVVLKSIPFVGWVTAIASLVSWFYLFNQSGDDVKQKLQDIQSAFDGVRKEIDDLFADAIRTDSIGTQLTELQSMLETAETELGIVIPIKLEDVNESNIEQKLKETRNLIDTYLNFSQTFSEAAVGWRFNEEMNEFGSSARTVYTSITESINSVVVALQELSDKGNASIRDIEILNELIAGQKEDESRIEYLQRLVRIYEELGLIGQKSTDASKYYLQPDIDNWEDLQAQQEQSIERLGIKNKSIFETMLNDVQGYYSSSGIAAYQFEEQVERVAQKIDINNIPVEQRTLRFQVAINEEASLNNWNEFAKEYARQIANTKYGTKIVISSDAKANAEAELQEWQKKLQEWANNNGITIPLGFQTDDTETTFANRKLQEAKSAIEDLETQVRKLEVGTGSQAAVDAAKTYAETAKEIARRAGADLSQLDKNRSKSGSKKDILGDALTKELQLITDIQKLYKEYTKAGVDSETAKTAAAKEYQNTLEQTNKELSKFGIQGLTGEQLATMDLRSMRDYYQSILDKVQSSPKAIEALEKAIRNLNVEITKTGQKTIIDSLNSELGKLKDEYELAVELDANPELGGVFADMMGLSKEELEKLPRDFEGVVRKLQSVVDKELGMGAFDVRSNLNKDVFDQWVKANKYSQDSDLVVKLKAITDYANKVRQDETKKQIEDWNKLLEKYAEYEYKRTQIMQEAERERETARKKGAPSHVMTAIDMKEAKDLAKVNIEEFQQSSEWITATGDLVGLTDEALGLLIRRIEEFKKSQKYLDAKQIKQLNNALKQLYQQQRKGNPFLQLSNAIQENKMRREEWRKELEEDWKIIEEQNKRIEEGTHLTEEETKTRLKLIDRIKELKEGLATLKDVTPEQVIDYLNTINSVASQATGAVSDMMKAFGNTEDAETINKVMSTIEKGLQFAQMGAAIGGQTAGGWGAVIGGIIGLLVGGITAFADEISGNAGITKQIEASERAVKRLQNAYINLESAVDKAYGTEKYYAIQVAEANKQAELAELRRQLRLEESRSSKYRDEDKILDLERQILELENEISDSLDGIVNGLLGISNVGDAVEDMVGNLIDALRNGEDAMDSFDQSIDEMIVNMVKKLYSSKVIGKWFDDIWSNIDEDIENRTSQYKKDLATVQDYFTSRQNAWYIDENGHAVTWQEYFAKKYGVDKRHFWGESSQQWFDAYMPDDIADAIKAKIKQASEVTVDDIRKYAKLLASGKPVVESQLDSLESLLRELGLIKDTSTQKLSNLQQGIQGITEDTAGALEAMLNGISQQVYLHSDILIEIRDVLQSFDFDVRTGVQAQILLELQTGFQTVNAMRTMMENWTTPAGNGIRVEML